MQSAAEFFDEINPGPSAVLKTYPHWADEPGDLATAYSEIQERRARGIKAIEEREALILDVAADRACTWLAGNVPRSYIPTALAERESLRAAVRGAK
jgi:hypothetical protein